MPYASAGGSRAVAEGFIMRNRSMYRGVSPSTLWKMYAFVFLIINNNNNITDLRRAFSSGLKCVSLCLFRTGGPVAEELESESEEAAVWLGSITEIGRLKGVEQEEVLLCLPGMRRTLWEPPVPAAVVTTTMAILYGRPKSKSFRIQLAVTLPRSN